MCHTQGPALNPWGLVEAHIRLCRDTRCPKLQVKCSSCPPKPNKTLFLAKTLAPCPLTRHAAAPDPRAMSSNECQGRALPCTAMLSGGGPCVKLHQPGHLLMHSVSYSKKFLISITRPWPPPPYLPPRPGALLPNSSDLLWLLNIRLFSHLWVLHQLFFGPRMCLFGRLLFIL